MLCQNQMEQDLKEKVQEKDAEPAAVKEIPVMKMFPNQEEG